LSDCLSLWSRAWGVISGATALVAVLADLFHLGASSMVVDAHAVDGGVWMHAGDDTRPTMSHLHRRCI
jgi:hypothetical protein